jgi:uncharacterized protein with HEPN domain
VTTESVAQRYGDASVVALRDFRGFAAQAARLVERGRPAFDSDEMLRLAGDAVVVKLGAAVARVDERLVADHPELMLRLVKDMRNLVAHEYDAIRPAIVWNALERELPIIDELIGGLIGDPH